jgi:hypothetical protein
MGPLCRGTVVVGQIPATRVTGSEGRGCERQEGTKPHLIVALGGEVVDRVWQNRLNYSSSSALVIAIQPIITQRTSNRTTHWSVGSLPDTTTVQQDRGRFTSHEGEFTIIAQLINF